MDQIEAAAQAEGPINDDPVSQACEDLIGKLYESPTAPLTTREVDLIKVALTSYATRVDG
jgi:hypothetical protein